MATNNYQPEKLTAYTVGSRNWFFGSHLQVNVEGFYFNYKNKQESAVGLTPVGNLFNLTHNAAAATLKGGSLGIFATPTRSDPQRLFAQYNDTKYDNFVLDMPGFL